MSQIRCVYHGHEPEFPASDQHPDAVRYKVGQNYVDAIGGEPTAEEVAAFLAPPVQSAPIVLPEDADLPTLAAFVKQLAERAG